MRIKFPLLILSLLLSRFLFSQNMGIGTVSPKARLHVLDSNVVFSTSVVELPTLKNDPPISGAGRRMMWYADKAAFCVGGAVGDSWDKPSIGDYSFSCGLECTSSGTYAISGGHLCEASGFSSVALGYNCSAMGNYSIAMGYDNSTNSFGVAMGQYCNAYGVNTIAIGSLSDASGTNSIAIGNSSSTFNDRSIAVGNQAIAFGSHSIAIGNLVTASGSYSMALGNYVSTSGFEGCLTIGDKSTTTIMETFVANGFRSRFAGGYRLFTNSAANIGAFLNANANSWAALSDVRMKENFLPVDGEGVLLKIAAMPQYTWNYIGQDVKTLRHYGPMAQDFYGAFGKDALGEIGCDTLINQQDFLGVNLIAIQALEKRTGLMQQELDDTKKMLKENQLQLAELKEQNRLLSELLKRKE
jgi:hypothetical protein